MKHNLVIALVSAFTALMPPVAMAQNSSFETPQYAGQTPGFDRGMDNYRDMNDALRASRQRLRTIQRDDLNDLAVERQNAYRSQRVQDEMTRQREIHQRANERYILETNQ
jgi:hypothetical protein